MMSRVLTRLLLFSKVKVGPYAVVTRKRRQKKQMVGEGEGVEVANDGDGEKAMMKTVGIQEASPLRLVETSSVEGQFMEVEM